MRECVPKLWQCDGDNDCGNDSDEGNCEERDCGDGALNCGLEGSRKLCVLGQYECDHDDDCGNGADEVNCETVRFIPFHVHLYVSFPLTEGL